MRLFTNARVPGGSAKTQAAEFLVKDGRFLAFGAPGSLRRNGESTDLQGALVLPGVIDGHVHFDDPGYTWRETFSTGTRAAAAGGVTCVVDMPCTSLPPVVDEAALREKLRAVESQAHVDFMFWGGICANRIEEGPEWRQDLLALAQCGVGAVKCYLHSGMDSFRAVDEDQLVEIARECARLGLPLGVHAEDRAFVQGREAEPVNAALPAWDAWWRTRSGEAERLAALRMVRAARASGAHLHVVHLGSGEALQVIRQAQADGLRLSAETCPHYLAFTREDFPRLGSVLKTAPPVKEEVDRLALWEGLSNGSIAFATTDHAAGQWPQEKHTASFRSDYGGIPGVEHLLPYLLTHGVQAGRLDLSVLVERLCAAPARFFGLADRKGSLAPGMDADFVVVDDAASWTVEASTMHTLNRYTPFQGQHFGARVTQTWVRGCLVYEHDGDRFPQGGGWGRFTRRHGRDRG